MFMVLSSWQSHCESSLGSFDKCRTAPSGHRPKTKPDDLCCESTCTGCQNLHPPSPFIITQPESWYSFYHPTEGRRLSRPSWLVTYRDGWWQVKMPTVVMSKVNMWKVNMWKVTMSTSGKCQKSTSQNVAWSHTHRTWQMTEMCCEHLPCVLPDRPTVVTVTQAQL